MRKTKTKHSKRQRLSKQRRWAIEQVALGNCGQCGRPRNLYAALCDLCSRKQRIAKRKKYKLGSYKKGHRGRPPIFKEQVSEHAADTSTEDSGK